MSHGCRFELWGCGIVYSAVDTGKPKKKKKYSSPREPTRGWQSHRWAKEKRKLNSGLPIPLLPVLSNPFPLSPTQDTAWYLKYLTSLNAYRDQRNQQWLGEHRVWHSQTPGQHGDNAKLVPSTHPNPRANCKPPNDKYTPVLTTPSPPLQGRRHLKLRQPRQQLPPLALL